MIGGGLGDFAPGEWTDDTSMTWAIADVAATGLDLRTPEALDAIAARFRDWYDTRPPDIGINTRAVISAAGASPTGAAMTAAAQARHEATGRTGSNGSLMRTAAVGLTHLDDPAALAEAAMAVSALTHADPRAQEACALWSLAIRHAVLTASTTSGPGSRCSHRPRRRSGRSASTRPSSPSPRRSTPTGTSSRLSRRPGRRSSTPRSLPTANPAASS